MEITILRQFWSLVEATQTNTLLLLNETDLVDQLLKKFDSRQQLSLEQNQLLAHYIRSKTSLIRDLAASRAG